MLLVCVITFSAVVVSLEGGFPFGTVFRGYEDAEEIILGVEPARIEADIGFEGAAFTLTGLPEDEIENIKVEHIALGGYFGSSSVSGIEAEHGTLIVEISASALPDIENLAEVDWQGYTGGDGLIAFSPEAFKSDGFYYQGTVTVIYPELISETEAIGQDYDGNISQDITLTLKNDIFKGTLTADDLEISGGFESVKAENFNHDGNSLSFTLTGKSDGEFGVANFNIPGDKLEKGLGVSFSLGIGRVPMPVQARPLLVMNDDTQTLDIYMEYDGFTEDINLSMLSFGGIMNDFDVIGLERRETAILSLALKGRPGAGTGTIRFDGTAVLSGHTGRVAEITVSEPEVSVEQYVPAGMPDPFFKITLDNVLRLEEGDIEFELGGALSGLKVTEIRWSGNSAKIYTEGTAAEGAGTIKVSGLYETTAQFELMEGGTEDSVEMLSAAPVSDISGGSDDTAPMIATGYTVVNERSAPVMVPAMAWGYAPLVAVTSQTLGDWLDFAKDDWTDGSVDWSIFDSPGITTDFGPAWSESFSSTTWGEGAFPAEVSPGGSIASAMGSIGSCMKMISGAIGLAKGVLSFIGKHTDAEWYHNMLKFLGMGPSQTDIILAQMLYKLDGISVQIDQSTGMIMSRLDEINYNVVIGNIAGEYNRIVRFYEQFVEANHVEDDLSDENAKIYKENYNIWLKANVAYPNKKNQKVDQLFDDLHVLLNALDPGHTDSMKTGSLIRAYEQQCRSNLPFEHNLYIYMDRYIASWVMDIVGITTMLQEIENYNLYIRSPYILMRKKVEEGDVLPGQTNYVSREVKKLMEKIEKTLTNIQTYLENAPYKKAYDKMLYDDTSLYVVTNTPAKQYLLAENKAHYMVYGETRSEFLDLYRLAFETFKNPKIGIDEYMERANKDYDFFYIDNSDPSRRSANPGGKDAKGIVRKRNAINWQNTRPFENAVYDGEGENKVMRYGTFALAVHDVGKEDSRVQDFINSTSTFKNNMAQKGKGQIGLGVLLDVSIKKINEEDGSIIPAWFETDYTHLYVAVSGKDEKARLINLKSSNYAGYSETAKKLYKNNNSKDKYVILMVLH
jgi:hypothetical protein